MDGYSKIRIKNFVILKRLVKYLLFEQIQFQEYAKVKQDQVYVQEELAKNE